RPPAGTGEIKKSSDLMVYKRKAPEFQRLLSFTLCDYHLSTSSVAPLSCGGATTTSATAATVAVSTTAAAVAAEVAVAVTVAASGSREPTTSAVSSPSFSPSI